MPASSVSEQHDVPACDRCGGEAAFNDPDRHPICEYCAAVDFGIDWGRRSAYAELASAILSACAAVGTPVARLHELVDVAGMSEAIELPLAPADGADMAPMSEGPWLAGLTPITGRGEAIIATRRGGAR